MISGPWSLTKTEESRYIQKYLMVNLANVTRAVIIKDNIFEQVPTMKKLERKKKNKKNKKKTSSYIHLHLHLLLDF